MSLLSELVENATILIRKSMQEPKPFEGNVDIPTELTKEITRLCTNQNLRKKLTENIKQYDSTHRRIINSIRKLMRDATLFPLNGSMCIPTELMKEVIRLCTNQNLRKKLIENINENRIEENRRARNRDRFKNKSVFFKPCKNNDPCPPEIANKIIAENKKKIESLLHTFRYKEYLNTTDYNELKSNAYYFIYRDICLHWKDWLENKRKPIYFLIKKALHNVFKDNKKHNLLEKELREAARRIKL